jgi:cytochrome c
VGPTFTDIANKYEGQQGAVENLVEKVIKGGSGVWGDLMMSPHPQLSNADTEKMIAYILSLSGKSVKGGLPYKGAYALNKHKPTEKEGTYIFTASYTDKGANGMKPLTATKVLSLSYPMIGGDKFSRKKNVMTFNVTAGMMPGIEKDMTMTLPSDNAVLQYDDVDLTGVGKLRLNLVVAPTYFSGGSMNVLIDGVDGQKIGSGTFETGLTDLGFKEMVVDIDPVDGSRTLVFTFKCADATKIFAGLASIEFIL